MERPACQVQDYTFSFSECKNDVRKQTFSWRNPKFCLEDVDGAVILPKTKEVSCRGCGRGEHRNENDKCVFCEDGFYQDIDNHRLESGKKVLTCKECEAGKYAPKIKELGHFEVMPEIFQTSCSVAA